MTISLRQIKCKNHRHYTCKVTYARAKENAIPHARLGRKLLFHRQSLVQWIADGGDRANRASEGEQLTLNQLTGMLNNGQARVAPKRP